MHFLSITDLDEHQILDILNLADEIKAGKNNRDLAGKTVISFFPESGIRTRIAFEKAIHSLGGFTILFDPGTLDKREAMQDVVGYLETLADMLIIRHMDMGKLDDMAKHASIPIINAMTSLNHPCEILSDIYGLRTMRAGFQKLVYTFVGEQGNICRSWLNAAHVLDLRLNHVCCEGNRLQPDDKNYTFHTRLDEVLSISDVILTDSLSGQNQHQDYYQRYQITRQKMECCPKGAILNPCPPFYRGQEVSDDVIESPYFVGYRFKENLFYVHQAIMLYCLRTLST